MNISKLSSIAALTLLACAAQAQVITIKVPDEVPLPASHVTRAEVMADYHLWRLAGLPAFYRGDVGPDFESPEFRMALAKYEWLRASPQFAALVAQLSSQPNAPVLASK